MRRTRLQRESHQRMVAELLVEGFTAAQIVRLLAESSQLTPRQARSDLARVRAAWRREDDEQRQNRWKLRDLAVAADRAERGFRAALAAGDARLAWRIEKHRSKLLGLYDADRRRAGHLPDAEREEIIHGVEGDLDGMYADAPRNPDGSVVLTAYSRTPPPVDDERYRQQIERPLSRGPSPRRLERIADLRAALAAGVRLDELEAAARQRFGLSLRQVRSDVRLLEWQLEDDGHRLHQGTHELQSLPLAVRRRERIAELALRPRDAEPDDGVARPEHGSDGRGIATGEDAARCDGHSHEPHPSRPLQSVPRAKPRAKPAKPHHRLAADVEIDRCRLLGLNARERPNPADDDLRWRPFAVGSDGWLGLSVREAPAAAEMTCRTRGPETDNPATHDPFTRPLSMAERIDYDQDRTIEIELAFLDAQNGHRHTAAELLPDLLGRPGRPGREPWKPPLQQPEEAASPTTSNIQHPMPHDLLTPASGLNKSSARSTGNARPRAWRRGRVTW